MLILWGLAFDEASGRPVPTLDRLQKGAVASARSVRKNLRDLEKRDETLHEMAPHIRDLPRKGNLDDWYYSDRPDWLNTRAQKDPHVPKPGFVYAISDGTAIKVGRSSNVRKRLSSLQSSNPRELSIVAQVFHDDSVAAERAAHEALAEYHIRLEWFSCDDRAAIEAIGGAR